MAPDPRSLKSTDRLIDVLVVGGGNAALCAALAAADAGARVTMIERAPMNERGGNSKYTRNIRVAHGSLPDMAGVYPPAELLEDLKSVTGDDLDIELARWAADESLTVLEWMQTHGVRWQPPLRGALQLDRTNRFFLGGGKALINVYYAEASRRGVEVRYEEFVQSIEPTVSGTVRAIVETQAGIVSRFASAVVIASGGFESNREWLGRYWGDAAQNYIVRGTRYNDGRLLANLLQQGAMERGNARSFHAVACDARSPAYDGGIVTRVDSIPFGVVVNRDCERFADEGADMWPKRYAAWGGLIAQQPDQLAYAIHDSSAAGRFIPSIYPPFRASSIEELAALVNLDSDRLSSTIRRYNESIPEPSDGDFSGLDGRGTRGLQIPKSNWAAPIASPPFFAYPLRPGVTFTYLGLAVDKSGRVVKTDGSSFPGIFAAGEVMAGNILRDGYLAGFGMTIGTVFGRLAGKEAALLARAA
jgi:tricarballylate dehydrogenase